MNVMFIASILQKLQKCIKVNVITTSPNDKKCNLFFFFLRFQILILFICCSAIVNVFDLLAYSFVQEY